ncbi:MAG: UspA domain protein [Chloroflexi bacterium]|nr:UspA domain protein [Chloroflexota bacterium]
MLEYGSLSFGIRNDAGKEVRTQEPEPREDNPLGLAKEPRQALDAPVEPFETIAVPLDGSPLSKDALAFALAISKRTNARLILIRACLTIAALYRGNASAIRIAAARQRAEMKEAETDLKVLAEGLRGIGARVEGHAYEGAAAAVILEQTAALGADLIVMSTHGRAGAVRLLLGSVADEVLRHAIVPICLVPSGSRPWPEDLVRRVLVPLDGSRLAEEILIPALRLADSFHAEIILVRVEEPTGESGARDEGPYLDQVAGMMRLQGRTVRTRVLKGPLASSASSIMRAAEEEEADVVAMATHGRGGLARLLMGSVAAAMLQQSRTPMLIARPSAMQ